jgi:hypothetical protein
MRLEWIHGIYGPSLGRLKRGVISYLTQTAGVHSDDDMDMEEERLIY